MTSDTRMTLAPDIPTFGESGLPAVSWSAWYGLFAPKHTPRQILSKLNAAAVEDWQFPEKTEPRIIRL